MNDTVLIDYLEARRAGLVNDGNDNWVMVDLPDVPDDPGYDITISLKVPNELWRASLREAILAYMENDKI